MRPLLAKARNGQRMLEAPIKMKKSCCVFSARQRRATSFSSACSFADSFVSQKALSRFSALDTDTYLGEVKFENTINRGTGVANPRQIEHIPRGMSFDFQLVYNIEDEAEMKEDLTVLADGFRLLSSTIWAGMVPAAMAVCLSQDLTTLKIDARTGEKTDCRELTRIFEGTKL